MLYSIVNTVCLSLDPITRPRCSSIAAISYVTFGIWPRNSYSTISYWHLHLPPSHKVLAGYPTVDLGSWSCSHGASSFVPSPLLLPSPEIETPPERSAKDQSGACDLMCSMMAPEAAIKPLNGMFTLPSSAQDDPPGAPEAMNVHAAAKHMGY